MNNTSQILTFLLNTVPELKMSKNYNFYIKNSDDYELFTVDDIRKVFNNKKLYVSVKDIEKIKDYFPVSSEINDKLSVNDPYVNYCSERLVDLSKDSENLLLYEKFLTEWNLYLKEGKRLINYNEYPYTHISEIRADLSNYLKENDILEDKETTLRFIKHEFHQTLNNMGLCPYKHKSYRITKTNIEGSVLFWIRIKE
jgi:hypothetical protein